MSADEQWVRYRGPRGGEGWEHVQTGEVRYQDSQPTERTGGAEPRRAPAKHSRGFDPASVEERFDRARSSLHEELQRQLGVYPYINESRWVGNDDYESTQTLDFGWGAADMNSVMVVKSNGVTEALLRFPEWASEWRDEPDMGLSEWAAYVEDTLKAHGMYAHWDAVSNFWIGGITDPTPHLEWMPFNRRIPDGQRAAMAEPEALYEVMEVLSADYLDRFGDRMRDEPDKGFGTVKYARPVLADASGSMRDAVMAIDQRVAALAHRVGADWVANPLMARRVRAATYGMFDNAVHPEYITAIAENVEFATDAGGAGGSTYGAALGSGVGEKVVARIGNDPASTVHHEAMHALLDVYGFDLSQDAIDWSNDEFEATKGALDWQAGPHPVAAGELHYFGRPSGEWNALPFEELSRWTALRYPLSDGRTARAAVIAPPGEAVQVLELQFDQSMAHVGERFRELSPAEYAALEATAQQPGDDPASRALVEFVDTGNRTFRALTEATGEGMGHLLFPDAYGTLGAHEVTSTAHEVLQATSPSAARLAWAFGADGPNRALGSAYRGVFRPTEYAERAEEKYVWWSDGDTDEKAWIPYEGPRGGRGWEQTETGRVRYQTKKPQTQRTLSGGETDAPRAVMPNQQAARDAAQGANRGRRSDVRLPGDDKTGMGNSAYRRFRGQFWRNLRRMKHPELVEQVRDRLGTVETPGLFDAARIEPGIGPSLTDNPGETLVVAENGRVFNHEFGHAVMDAMGYNATVEAALIGNDSWGLNYGHAAVFDFDAPGTPEPEKFLLQWWGDPSLPWQPGTQWTPHLGDYVRSADGQREGPVTAITENGGFQYLLKHPYAIKGQADGTSVQTVGPHAVEDFEYQRRPDTPMNRAARQYAREINRTWLAAQRSMREGTDDYKRLLPFPYSSLNSHEIPSMLHEFMQADGQNPELTAQIPRVALGNPDLLDAYFQLFEPSKEAKAMLNAVHAEHGTPWVYPGVEPAGYAIVQNFDFDSVPDNQMSWQVADARKRDVARLFNVEFDGTDIWVTVKDELGSIRELKLTPTGAADIDWDAVPQELVDEVMDALDTLGEDPDDWHLLYPYIGDLSVRPEGITHERRGEQSGLQAAEYDEDALDWLFDGEIPAEIEAVHPALDAPPEYPALPPGDDDVAQKASVWERYEGPRGGTGWRHPASGEVRYQDKQPESRESSGDGRMPAKRYRARDDIDPPTNDEMYAYIDVVEDFARGQRFNAYPVGSRYVITWLQEGAVRPSVASFDQESGRPGEILVRTGKAFGGAFEGDDALEEQLNDLARATFRKHDIGYEEYDLYLGHDGVIHIDYMPRFERFDRWQFQNMLYVADDLAEIADSLGAEQTETIWGTGFEEIEEMGVYSDTPYSGYDPKSPKRRPDRDTPELATDDWVSGLETAVEAHWADADDWWLNDVSAYEVGGDPVIDFRLSTEANENPSSIYYNRFRDRWEGMLRFDRIPGLTLSDVFRDPGRRERVSQQIAEVVADTLRPTGLYVGDTGIGGKAQPVPHVELQFGRDVPPADVVEYHERLAEAFNRAFGSPKRLIGGDKWSHGHDLDPDHPARQFASRLREHVGTIGGDKDRWNATVNNESASTSAMIDFRLDRHRNGMPSSIRYDYDADRVHGGTLRLPVRLQSSANSKDHAIARGRVEAVPLPDGMHIEDTYDGGPSYAPTMVIPHIVVRTDDAGVAPDEFFDYLTRLTTEYEAAYEDVRQRELTGRDPLGYVRRPGGGWSSVWHDDDRRIDRMVSREEKEAIQAAEYEERMRERQAAQAEREARREARENDPEFQRRKEEYFESLGRGKPDPRHAKDDDEADEKAWTRYEGPRGGTGWQHSSGEIRYQDAKPGRRTNSSRPPKRSPERPVPPHIRRTVSQALGPVEAPLSNLDIWYGGVDFRVTGGLGDPFIRSGIHTTDDGAIANFTLRLAPLGDNDERAAHGDDYLRRWQDLVFEAAENWGIHSTDVEPTWGDGRRDTAGYVAAMRPHIYTPRGVVEATPAQLGGFLNEVITEFQSEFGDIIDAQNTQRTTRRAEHEEGVDNLREWWDAMEEEHGGKKRPAKRSRKYVSDLPPGPDKAAARTLQMGLERIPGMRDVYLAESGRHLLIEFRTRDPDHLYPCSVSIDRDTGKVSEMTLRFGGLGDDIALTPDEWRKLEAEWWDVADDAAVGLDLRRYIDPDFGDRWVSDVARPHVRIGHPGNDDGLVDAAEVVEYVTRLSKAWDEKYGELEDRMLDHPERYTDYSDDE